MRNLTLVPVLAVFVCLQASTNLFAEQPTIAESVRNIAYHPAIRNSSDQIEVRSLRLVNGKYEKGRKNVDPDYELLQTGIIAYGDINLDGKTDAAVTLYHTKGNRQETQVAIVLDVKGKPTHVASREFGDGTEIMGLKIDKTFISDNRSAKLVERGVVRVEVSNEACCGGQGKTMTYHFENNQLIGQDPFCTVKK